MKHLKYLSFFLLIGLISCDKHVIEYDTEMVSGVAEFQLHYVVPVTSGAVNNIYKVEVNDQLYANDQSVLSTYNAIPNGSVGRFYTTSTGTNNIKLYKGSDLELVYNQNITLTEGKQNIFVYDFDEAPIVFDNGFPYEANITEHSDTTAWVKFYNFLYESGDQPTNLKLQYQYQYPIEYNEKGVVIRKSEWTNVGSPVSFGETTGWIPVIVHKSVPISSGYARLDYKIKVIDANGNDTGDLQIMNSSNNFVNYSDWWTAYVGRRYHHTISGMRAAKPTSAVRVFTAL